MPEELKTLTFELKEVAEDGTFTGIASVYGVEDLGRDVIDKGAFVKTIGENPTVPILWQHKPDEVIGEGEVSEWQGKILIKGRLDLEDSTAVKAYGKMKRRLVRGLSIGFSTIKSTFQEIEGRMVRHIQELKLWEVSIVTFPMLPDAQVVRVKDTSSTLAADGDAADGEPRKSTEPDDVHSTLAPLVQGLLDLLQRKGY
jgi:uncharacterized protein